MILLLATLLTRQLKVILLILLVLLTPRLHGGKQFYDSNSLYSTDGSTTKTISGSNLAYRFPRYNNQNTASKQTDVSNYSATANVYSYGNYYTWAAAIADTGDYTQKNQLRIASICPKGWVLPIGGDKNNEADNDYWKLIVTNIVKTNPANYDNTINPYYTGAEGTSASKLIRKYPNN